MSAFLVKPDCTSTFLLHHSSNTNTGSSGHNQPQWHNPAVGVVGQQPKEPEAPQTRAVSACVPTSPIGVVSDNDSVCSQFDLTVSGASLPLSAASALSLPVPQFVQQQQQQKSGFALMRASSPQRTTSTPPVMAPAVEEVPPRRNESIVQRNVYISGLPSYMQSNEFRELCQRFGRVEASKLCVEGPSNPTKGYGFVLYYTEESAALCIKELSGSYLNGRCLQARLADTHATPHEMPQRVPPPPPPPSAPAMPNFDLSFNQSSNASNMLPPLPPAFAIPGNGSVYVNYAPQTMLYNDPAMANGAALNPIMVSAPGQLPMQFLSQPNTFIVAADGSLTSSTTYPMPGNTISAVNVNGEMSMSGNVVYATSAVPAGQPMQAYRISAVSGSGALQQSQPQPQPPQFVYAAPPSFVTANGGAGAGPAYFAAGAPTGGYATVSLSSPQPAHVLSPLVLTSAPPNAVQYISLAPAPASFPM